jgi:competence protein ComEA
MPPRFDRRLVLLAPLLLVPALLSLEPAPASLGQPRSCADAQSIAGELRCDEELLRDSSTSCPLAPAQRLGPGDALEPWTCRVERMSADELAALEQIVDLNHASATELASLPGIGPGIAARIIAGRPYASVEDLLAVRGIGPTRLGRIRTRARVRPRPR